MSQGDSKPWISTACEPKLWDSVGLQHERCAKLCASIAITAHCDTAHRSQGRRKVRCAIKERRKRYRRASSKSMLVRASMPFRRAAKDNGRQPAAVVAAKNSRKKGPNTH